MQLTQGTFADCQVNQAGNVTFGHTKDDLVKNYFHLSRDPLVPFVVRPSEGVLLELPLVYLVVVVVVLC